jgi:anti-sigma factor RsiW
MADRQPLSDADRADLIAYLDGELTGDARRRIETRLTSDPTLRLEADTLKRAWDMLEYLPRPGPSAEFATRTMDRVSAVSAPAAARSTSSSGPASPPRRGRRLWLVVGWSLAGLVAVALGFALTPASRPPTAASMDPNTDPLMTREPTVIENLPLYLAAENLEYLLALDQSDLFGEGGTGR